MALRIYNEKGELVTDVQLDSQFTEAGLPKLRVTRDSDDPLLDVLERIQQQVAQINNGNNLEAGERYFE